MSETASAILVLGMHRSGTSCLAGSLQQAGLELGKVFTKNAFNAKGNRENKDVMKLNEDVLEFSGGAWDAPPRELCWKKKHAKRRDGILKRLAAAADRSWGFKDPRALLTMPFWRESGVEFKFIGTIRHPLPVAQSLEARGGRPLAEGFALWLAYNRCLIALHDEVSFPVISFDAPDELYLDQVRQVVIQLGLDSETSDSPFFEGTLRRRFEAGKSPEINLPPEVEQLYRRLTEIAAGVSSEGKQ
ncbi:MAG: sulfotransferase family protein [Planctomycetota bacterium]